MKRPTSSANTYNSYQHGYQPPVFYAADQTKTLEDTTKTFYQADETAGHVLNSLQAQRQQISHAHTNANGMRETTDAAKRELEELRRKYREKKQRLYMWIAGLAFVDMMLFFRILQCHGNFYCF